MKRWGFFVAAVALGALSAVQTPVLAQSSLGSSQTVTQRSVSTVTADDSSSTTDAWPTATYNVTLGYDSEAGLGFHGTVWTAAQQPVATSSPVLVKGSASTGTQLAAGPADPTSVPNLDLSDSAATQGVVVLDTANATLDTAVESTETVHAPATAPLQAPSASVAPPLQAQSSLIAMLPLLAQASPGTTPTDAQSSDAATPQPPQVTNTLQVVFWSTNNQAYGPNGGVSWTTNLYGLDYRLESLSDNHWGFHLVGVTGSEGSWAVNGTTVVSVPLSGNDTLWSADVFYHWYITDVHASPSEYMLGVFLGFGGRNLSFNTNSAGLGSLSGSSSGPRFGAEGTFPLASGWAIHASIAYEPSETLTGNVFNALGTGTTGSASVQGTGLDYLASLQYTTTSEWIFSVGYWWNQDNLGQASVNGTGICPCSVTWQGPFLSVGKQF